MRGRYEILALAGRGGMGAVYEARVVGSSERVALKVMHGYLGRVREAEARFRREARALRKLHSPHVARLQRSQCANIYVALLASCRPAR